MQQIRDVLDFSDMPINSAEIATIVFGSKKSSSITRVQDALSGLIRSGEAYEHPPFAGGQKKRFWRDSPTAWTGERILELVAAKQKLTVRRAKNSIPSSYRPYFDEALGQLTRDNRVYLLGMGRIKYLMTRPPRPTEHLSSRHLKSIKEIISKVNPHRKTKLNLDDVLSLFDGQETDANMNPSSVQGVPDEMVSEWYKEDVRLLMGSKSVPIPWTWARYERWSNEQGRSPDLVAFKEKLKQLASDGTIELVPHGMSEPLTPHELKIAIRSDLGELLYFFKWLQEKSG